MTSFEFFRWATLCFGTTYVITQSMIFGPFRILLVGKSDFRRILFYCSACMGFWVGVIYALLLMWPMDYGHDHWAILRECAESGCASMAIGHIWGTMFPNPVYQIEQAEALRQLYEHEPEGETGNDEEDDEDDSA